MYDFGFRLEEVEMCLPFEREIYIGLLQRRLEEENQKAKEKEALGH